MQFKVGYEIGSGKEVQAELHHLAIFGLTQKSGKTTALEAFINRIDGKASALIFRTGRGEIGFSNAVKIPFFFRERTDWQFVEGLISAHLHEKARFYRGDIMRACQGARSLRSVWFNVGQSLDKAREGTFVQKIYTELDQYLNEIVPSLESISFSKELTLKPGTVHVMDLEQLKPSMQQLIIAATIDRIMEKHRNVIVVLPEARDFIPEDRRTPAKLSVENLIRKGAKLGNYLWCDSQALTGLDLDVMRNVGVWMFGRQDLDREAERSSKSIPGKIATSNDIRSLKVGEFYLVQGEVVRKVYVQPDWLKADELASEIARDPKKRSLLPEADIWQQMRKERIGTAVQVEKGDRKKIMELEEQLRKRDIEIAGLKEINAALSKDLDRASMGGSGPTEIDIESREIRIKIRDQVPEIRKFTTDDVEGKIMFVLVKDLDGEALQSDLIGALVERGWPLTQIQTNIPLMRLTKAGTLIKSKDKPFRYRLPGKLSVELEGSP